MTKWKRETRKQKKRLKEFAGKWWLWDNGLRFKITGDLDGYGEWIAENAKGHRWSVRPFVMVESNAKELTEAQAKEQYVEIENGTCYEGFCSCCAWKNGQPQIKAKLKLAQGKPPYDECSRLEDELRKFFYKEGVYEIVPYISRTDDGIQFQFISRRIPDNDKIHYEKLVCGHCKEETEHQTRKHDGVRWFQKCTKCEWHMFEHRKKYEPPVGEIPVGTLDKDKFYNEYYIDERHCDHCDKETPHRCKDSTHERDSSDDYQECLVCKWWMMGYSRKYNAPSGD